jgi:hypothetical protein
MNGVVFQIQQIFVADLATTIFSQAAARAVPDSIVSVCPHCVRPLLVPPCAQKSWITGTKRVIFCFQCARQHHPEAAVCLMGNCSTEKKLIKAQAERN